MEGEELFEECDKKYLSVISSLLQQEPEDVNTEKSV